MLRILFILKCVRKKPDPQRISADDQITKWSEGTANPNRNFFRFNSRATDVTKLV